MTRWAKRIVISIQRTTGGQILHEYLKDRYQDQVLFNVSLMTWTIGQNDLQHIHGQHKATIQTDLNSLKKWADRTCEGQRQM